MLKGYHYLNNSHAFNQLNKSIATANVRLGIGEGEDLLPQPNIVFYPNIPKQPTVPSLTNASIEQATIDGFADPISEEDFPKNLYYGEALGGF
jgi:hypothetical protein